MRVNVIDYGNDDNADTEIGRLCNLLSCCGKIDELAISESKLNRDNVKSITEAVKSVTVILNNYVYFVQHGQGCLDIPEHGSYKPRF